MSLHVHFFGAQGIGWALDEDLRWAMQTEAAVPTSFGRARVIHSAWWPPLIRAGSAALRDKVVVCFADNPPAFYLTQPGFAEVAGRVNLWIARSQEAVSEFKEIGLPVSYAPYTVDPEIFRPMQNTERAEIRSSLGIGPEDFLVGNFHRDSLERDVLRPKAQKAPDVFLEIVLKAREAIPHLKVLLAGPRRHWLRRELARAGVPFVFVGEVRETDDFHCNVLPRSRLNELYNALDAVLIPSRWEGGPYAALEGLFAGRAVVSTEVGMARDVLPGWTFTTVAQAVELLVNSRVLDYSHLRKAVLATHSSRNLGEHLRTIYADLPSGKLGTYQAARATIALLGARFRRQAFQPDSRVAAMALAVQRRERRGGIVDRAIAIAEALET